MDEIITVFGTYAGRQHSGISKPRNSETKQRNILIFLKIRNSETAKKKVFFNPI